MIKLILLLTFLLFPAFAFASEQGGFFHGVFSFFGDVWTFLTITIPETIQRGFAWFGAYLIYLKYLMIKSSLHFANAVAVNFLNLIEINQVIREATSLLPPDLRQAAVDMRLFESLTLLVEAAITRFVYEVVS